VINPETNTSFDRGFESKQETRVWGIHKGWCTVQRNSYGLCSYSLRSIEPRHIYSAILHAVRNWLHASTSLRTTCGRSLNAPPRKYNEISQMRAHIPQESYLTTGIIRTNGWTDWSKERFRSNPPGRSTGAHVPKGFFAYFTAMMAWQLILTVIAVMFYAPTSGTSDEKITSRSKSLN
jgi:hypothetical protein